MRVIPFGEIEGMGEREISDVTNVRKLLMGLEMVYGMGFLMSIKDYSLILVDSREKERTVAIDPILLDIDMNGYDMVFIIPKIEGEVPLAVGLAVASALGASGGLATVIAWGVVILANVAISVAIGAIMQAISPTPTTSNAKEAQKRDSNLWNGGQATMEQGGPLPMVFGHPYCGGGTIIASSITSEDREVKADPIPIVDATINPLIKTTWVV